MARLTAQRKLLKNIVAFAHEEGWLVAHFHDVTVRPGVTVTPAAIDGKGFPDCVLVRERVVFAELKGEGRRALEIEQLRWRSWLLDAGAEHYVWNPSDWRNEIIQSVLRKRGDDRYDRLLAASRGDRKHAFDVQRLIEGS